jgi:hypothetical protein
MVGFPHSEIPGSKLIRSSPRLIAAYYVLHRLHTPRHPLDALKTLDRSHYQCPQYQQPHPALVFRVKPPSSGLLVSRASLPWFDRSDQKNQISRAHPVSPRGCRVIQYKTASLYDVQDQGCGSQGINTTKLCSLSHTLRVWRRSLDQPPVKKSIPNECLVVEPDGIEPTTSCLQSRRSPS